MVTNSLIQHRTKHFELLLARELSLIEREHSQNLAIHQKLENSIRQANNQFSNTQRNKISLLSDSLYNERIGSKQNRLLSLGTIGSNSSQNQTNLDQLDDFSDDTSSYNSFRRRRHCTKTQRLPSITRPNISNQQKQENKNQHRMASFQQSNLTKENLNQPFTIFNDEITKPNLSEFTPIQRQVRSFLETLPTYKEVQHGFDSFAPASLYSNRAHIAIR